MPMVRVSDRTFRVRVKGDTARPPRYWDLREWLPHQEEVSPSERISVYLGRSERLEGVRLTRIAKFRFFPENGEWPKDFARWVDGVKWLHDKYREQHPGFGTPEYTAQKLAAAREEKYRNLPKKSDTLQDRWRKLLD